MLSVFQGCVCENEWKDPLCSLASTTLLPWGWGEGCMVVADLEQQGGQGLDISLWHFQGPWLLGTRRGPGGLVKIGGALGVTSLQRWGCGRDSGALWGGGCPLCCAHTPPPSLHPESWLGLADWVFKTLQGGPQGGQKVGSAFKEFTTQMKGQEQPHGMTCQSGRAPCQVWTCGERTENRMVWTGVSVLAPGAHRQAGPRARS